LELQHLFLHRVASDEPIGKHLAGLADPVRAVDGLGLNRRVPPGIEKINIFRRVQVEPQTAGFEADRNSFKFGSF
jgi:hypothetical protein